MTSHLPKNRVQNVKGNIEMEKRPNMNWMKMCKAKYGTIAHRKWKNVYASWKKEISIYVSVLVFCSIVVNLLLLISLANSIYESEFCLFVCVCSLYFFSFCKKVKNSKINVWFPSAMFI